MVTGCAACSKEKGEVRKGRGSITGVCNLEIYICINNTFYGTWKHIEASWMRYFYFCFRPSPTIVNIRYWFSLNNHNIHVTWLYWSVDNINILQPLTLGCTHFTWLFVSYTSLTDLCDVALWMTGNALLLKETQPNVEHVNSGKYNCVKMHETLIF